MVFGWILLGFIVFLVVAGIVIYFVIIWNGLVRLRRNIDKSWGNIDVILKQRHDELPRLVEVCKGYMKYERPLLEKITDLRTQWMKAQTMAEKARISGDLTAALKTLFAVAENYPQLRAVETFSHLQTRISGLENELADRREFYNDSVTEWNIRIAMIPDMWVAGPIMHAQPAELFKVAEAEKAAPEIKF